MKLFFRIFLFFPLLFSCVSTDINKNNLNSNNNSTQKINEYGGKTIYLINDKITENHAWLSAIEYYDDNDNLIKTDITTSSIITEETGIIRQIEYYDKEIITRYEMFYSDEFKKIHDFNRAVEIVGNNKTAIRTIWFIDDIIIDVVDYPQDKNRYQFYNIEFIENELLLVLNEMDSQNENIVLSAKYVNIRSVVKFDTNLFEINEDDKRRLNYYSSFAFITPAILSNYNKKVRVFHEDKYYWFYVHSQLEQHISGRDSTIKYIPQLWNDELYLLGLGVYIFN